MRHDVRMRMVRVMFGLALALLVALCPVGALAQGANGGGSAGGQAGGPAGGGPGGGPGGSPGGGAAGGAAGNSPGGGPGAGAPGAAPSNGPEAGRDGGLGLFFSFPFGRRSPEPPPPRLLTDTIEYCNQLAVQVNQDMARVPRPPIDVTELATEGQHLCAIGKLRPGIHRLKMAIQRLQYRP